MKKSFIITSMAAFAALCFGLTAQAQGPVVVSDKDDYSPGEIALFSAAGFQPNELLDFSVAISDENGGWVPDIAWADVPADASGGAEVDYIVPETWANKTLQLTVMGLSSGLMATTTFTDTVTSATLNSPTTGSPAMVTTAGGLINANISYTTVNAPPNQANVQFLIDGVAYAGNQFNGRPLNETNVNYSVTVPAGLSLGCHDLTLRVGHQSFLNTTQTCAIVVTAPPPTNQPPVITPVSDVSVDLGQIVGCLDGNGGFGTSVEVEYNVSQVDANNFNVYATFDGNNQTLIGTVFDADGNLQLANIVPTPTSQTLTFTGPGSDTESFSTAVTATDDDGDFDTETCPTAGDATVQVVYNFSGFFPPLSGQINCKVKQGSGIPVKFSITDCSGNPITTGDHTISVAYHAGVGPDGDPDVDDAGQSGDNGINFRYDPTGIQWIFNLKTNSEYIVGNTYKITAHLDDGTDHDVYINIKR